MPRQRNTTADTVRLVPEGTGAGVAPAVSSAPDPRLVALARLLARQAARKFVNAETASRARAEREGWTVVDSYTDRAISGASLLRPGMQELIADGLRRRFDLILTESLDRLSRDLPEGKALI